MIRLPALLAVVAALVLGACAASSPSVSSGTPMQPSPTAPPSAVPPAPPTGAPSSAPPSGIAVPAPTCGGAAVSIGDALPCETIATLALEALARSAPALLATGVAGIDVYLDACPEDAVPDEIDCRGEPWAQFVTITFGPPGGGEASETGLTVVVAPASGRVLGISDELVL